MNLSTSILVVDDKDDAGLQIIKALWDGGFSARFIQYDGRILKRIKREKSAARGVRVVFMDINLISGAMGADAQNFSAIQGTLETILNADNGPYLLVTWSSHDDYAERLFTYLNLRLELSRRPVATRRLSKTDFEGSKSVRLPNEVKRILSDIGFAGCLMAWESLVRDASVATLSKISGLAGNLPDHADYPDQDRKLGAIIRSFAQAEAADHIDSESAFPALASVLSEVLYDEAFALTESLSPHHGPSIMTMAGLSNEATRIQINQALHVEYGGVRNRTPAPGDVFVFPTKGKRNRGGLPILDFDEFVPDQFFEPGKWKNCSAEQRSALLAGSRLILVEITPPCDHASRKKLVWHRYVLGVEVNDVAAKYLKKADYLKTLPTFSGNQGTAITISLNSRATASVQPSAIDQIGRRLYRLRSALLSEVIRWVSGQQSRLGYLEL